MKRTISVITVSILSILLFACATTKQQNAHKDESPQALLNQGKHQLKKQHYAFAVESFEALEAQYPFGELALKAQLGAIYAYFKNQEYAQAHYAADRFIRTNPLDSRVDYAHYIKALSNYMLAFPFPERYLPSPIAKKDVSVLNTSYQDFNTLITRYPNSKYAQDSRLRMVYLRDILAHHEFHVAEFYCKREAYIACANRANFVIKHYPHAKIMPETLNLLAHANKELGLNELASMAHQAQ